MSNTHLKVPSAADVLYVARNLRHSDVNELILATGCRDMVKVVLRSCLISEVCFGLYYNSCIVGLAGASKKDENGWSVPWMVATPEFENDRKAAVRISKNLFWKLISMYPKMVNLVSTENETSIRWLSWLGFTIAQEAQEFGPMNAPFYKFSIEGVLHV